MQSHGSWQGNIGGSADWSPHQLGVSLSNFWTDVHDKPHWLWWSTVFFSGKVWSSGCDPVRTQQVFSSDRPLSAPSAGPDHGDLLHLLLLLHHLLLSRSLSRSSREEKSSGGLKMHLCVIFSLTLSSWVEQSFPAVFLHGSRGVRRTRAKMGSGNRRSPCRSVWLQGWQSGCFDNTKLKCYHIHSLVFNQAQGDRGKVKGFWMNLKFRKVSRKCNKAFFLTQAMWCNSSNMWLPL